MSLNGEEYTPDDKDQIKTELVSAFRNRFPDGNVSIGDISDAMLETDARITRDQQEALRAVYESGYLDTATGENLDKLVELIGLSRREAVPATGVERFGTGTPPTSTGIIPKGTEITTGGSTPISFETTTVGELQFIDGFENGLGGWTGDTGNFSTSQQSFARQEYVLDVPATSGVSIIHDSKIRRGTRFGFYLYPQANTITAIRFARQDADNYYSAIVDNSANELRLEKTDGGSTTVLDTTATATPGSEISYVDVDWTIENDLTLTLYDTGSRGTSLGASSANDATFATVTGDVAIASLDANNVAYVDDVGINGVTTTIEGQTGGTESNVGPRSITVLPSPSNVPSAVTSVTNPVPTGDNIYDDTTNTALVIGRDREEDEDLRERARGSTSLGGAGTAIAIGTAIEELESTQSVTIYQNRSANDNTGSGGLPAHGVEAVVFGGTDEEVGQAIFENVGVTANLYGGANGTATSYTATSDVLGDNDVIDFSRPTVVNLDIDVEIAHNDNYVGDDVVKDRLVEIIGGTTTDGAAEPGLNVGDNVYVGILQNELIDPDDTGIIDADFPSIDSDNDGTSNVTEGASGAEYVPIANNEVAQTNGSDGSITVTSTQI